MDVSEAGWLTVERRGDETIRAALVRTLREEIVSGSLRPGVRLPPSRVLARQLRISRGVVSEAYSQLDAQGFVAIRPRAAPVVMELHAATGMPHDPVGADPAPRYDLTPTTPDVTLFPLSRWVASYGRAARRAPIAALDYREHRGEAALRSVLADHLGRTRGVVTDPQRILICQGTAQSLDLVVRVLANRGARSVAVEDPSHTTAHERIRAHGLDVIAQPVDGEGIVVQGLRADGVLVTPAHQFPTGVVLTARRRRELLHWASKSNAFVLEDDYDAEFRFDQEPARALQGVAPDRVVQLGTVSKTLAPGLRLGWLVAPDSLIDELVAVKRLLDDFSPTLDQLALADLLASGEYDRHVHRCRAVYRRRRDLIIESLTTNLPELLVEGVAAGMHLVLRLPDGADDGAVSSAAEQVGVRVPALSGFEVRASGRRGLVIGYGRLHESAAASAIVALAGVVRSLVLS